MADCGTGSLQLGLSMIPHQGGRQRWHKTPSGNWGWNDRVLLVSGKMVIVNSRGFFSSAFYSSLSFIRGSMEPWIFCVKDIKQYHCTQLNFSWEWSRATRRAFPCEVMVLWAPKKVLTSLALGTRRGIAFLSLLLFSRRRSSRCMMDQSLNKPTFTEFLENKRESSQANRSSAFNKRDKIIKLLHDKHWIIILCCKMYNNSHACIHLGTLAQTTYCMLCMIGSTFVYLAYFRPSLTSHIIYARKKWLMRLRNTKLARACWSKTIYLLNLQ